MGSSEDGGILEPDPSTSLDSASSWFSLTTTIGSTVSLTVGVPLTMSVFDVGDIVGTFVSPILATVGSGNVNEASVGRSSVLT